MEQKQVIRLKGVSVYHGGDCRSEKALLREGEMVLSGIDLEVERGEFV